MKKSEKVSIAYQIIDILRSKKGFDDWWDNIDEDIQLELLEKISETVEPDGFMKFYKSEQN